MADGEVTLVIRSPSLKQEEREVKAPRGCSVWELKSQLRRELPGGPMEQDQRLIYSGKLLPDHLKLSEVLSMENRHVLHLVFSMRSQAAEYKPSSTTQPTASQTDGVRQRNSLPNVPSAQENPPRPQAASPPLSPYSMYSPQQILWWHQMYARQYYMQYGCREKIPGLLSQQGIRGLLQHYAAAAATTTSPSQRRQELPVVPPAAPDPLPHPFPAANQAPNPDVQAPVNPVANQNLRMNAQGGVVEEEDEVNRDWLDWVYTAARFSIFLSILYFYSSLTRFMMVLGAMIVMYLHTAGWFAFRQRQPQEAAVAQPQAAGNQQDQNNNLQQQENGQVAEEAPNEAATATLQAQSFTSTAWVFFKTFFASLIPEGPPAMVQ